MGQWTRSPSRIGGAAKFTEVSEEGFPFFVRLHSYLDEVDDTHELFDYLVRPGAIFRVTIERIG